MMFSHREEDMNMNYATIKNLDIANGPGLSVDVLITAKAALIRNPGILIMVSLLLKKQKKKSCTY